MFEGVPGDVQDVDRRRFNRIIGLMDKAGKKHSFTPVEVASPSSLPLFTVSDGCIWNLAEERKLSGDERPDPVFDIVAVDILGTWLLDGSGKSAERQEVIGSAPTDGPTGSSCRRKTARP